MRIASLRLPQTRPYTISGSVLQRCNLSIARRRCRFPRRQHPLTIHQAVISSLPHRGLHDDITRSFSSSIYRPRRRYKQQDGLARTDKIIPVLSDAEQKDPETWVNLVKRYLPEDSTADKQSQEDHVSRVSSPTQSDRMRREILLILDVARNKRNAGIDILAHMISTSNGKAALWICNFLLEDLTSRTSSRPSSLPPSNILWPQHSLDWITSESIDVSTISHTSFESCDMWEKHVTDPRHTSAMSDVKDTTMEQIWTTLGTAIALSTKATEEQAQQAMNIVKLILGQIHKLNLVPDNVYAYEPSSYSVTVQRSPLIYLVSSQILTALSDATWRDQQQENIEKAASHGLSYKEIGRDPPGGRFRLKVSPIGSEIWLEFVLWCCVEGGFTNAGLRIIDLMHQDAEDPWFAVTWSKSDNSYQSISQDDWDRARTIAGDTSGRIEGHSKVKAFAEVPRRTISTEVVLALVEAYIDYVQREPGSKGMSLERTQDGIKTLLAFLEPHDLPVWYFDYVSSRLMQTGAFGVQRSRTMTSWINRLLFLKSLKTAQKPPPPRISFQLDSLSTHSEFTAAFMHQVLESHIQEGNIHDALRTFDDLQKLVDNSKLHAITAFLQHIRSPDADFSSSPFTTGNPEFVNSHGQLPLYKLAALLNLATDTNLVGFGQWLVYSYDPDGPLIPKQSYGNPGIAKALVRFAALSNDKRLLQAIPKSPKFNRRASVNMLRVSFDAQISLLEFGNATEIMKDLGQAQGGGFGLNNLAHLAGVILKLEHSTNLVPGVRTELLHDATFLLNSILADRFPGRSGVYQSNQRTKFRQQVALLLSVFQKFPQSSIARLADMHVERFRTTNMPNLSPSVFNTFLEAVVSVEGAKYGKTLADSYCVSHEEAHNISGALSGDYIAEGGADTDENFDEQWDQDDTQRAVSTASMRISDRSFIPLLPSQDLNDDSLVLQNEISEKAPSNDSDEQQHNAKDVNASPVRTSPDEITFDSPFFKSLVSGTDDQITPQTSIIDDVMGSGSAPIAIFDSSTIRIIVRKAIQEKKQEEDMGNPPHAQNHVLKWAKAKFRELGHSEPTIANETQGLTLEAEESTSSNEDTGTRNSRRFNSSRFNRKGISPITRSFGG